MPTPVIHLFRPGTHIDMGGQELTFSESDLTATVNAYDPALHEAPLCIGHPKDDAPAYGWVQSMRMAADGPEATPHQVNADFAEMHKTGAFKKVSASFYPPNSPHNPVPGVYYLRHVAFLGAQPPAIKGLRPAEFAEANDCITIEFSEYPEEAPATDESTVPPLPTDIPEPSQEETTVTPEEAAALEAKNQKLEADLKAERAARAKDAADRAHEENANFCEQLATDTRIGKDDVEVMTAALDALQASENLNFGEGDDAKPLHLVLKDTLGAMPQRVEFGESVTHDKAADADDDTDDSVQYAEGTPQEMRDLDQKIRAHSKKHNVTYAAALQAVANK